MDLHPTKRFETKLALWEQGAILASEFADNFLLDFVDGQNMNSHAEYFRQLPKTLQSAIRDRIESLRAVNFYWEPFFIGGKPTPEYCRRLQEQIPLFAGVIAEEPQMSPLD